MPWGSEDEAKLTRDIIDLGKSGGMSWEDFKDKHGDKCSETTDEDASGFGW